jgi:DNA-directed RNA polymerase specialized sigma24 family protein
VKAAKRKATQADGTALYLVTLEDAEVIDSIVSPSATPEAAVIAEEEAVRIRHAILDLFADDVVAQTIVEGDMEGMEAEEIRNLTGLDKTAYASARRLIRRRIDKAFPEGWKP